MKITSVKSFNLFKSPDYLGAGVIKMGFDKVKANKSALKAETEQEVGRELIIVLFI